MVFFNCNGCGEALKKNQVEKHALRCRQCEVLSCVDCGKDFWGNDYQNHTKCMTENEKYCGKGYVPKVNKGEVKQEQWIEKVQSAIERSASNPKLKGVLERLKDYPNIPRKKIKFENFLKNSFRVGSQPLISQVWDTLMAATGQNQDGKENGTVTDKKTGNESAPQMSLLSNTTPDIPNGDNSPSGEATDEGSSHKLSKRERKEERRKKANKKEKKDKSIENGDVEEGHRKGKKRTHEEAEEETQVYTPETASSTVSNDDSQPERKKKKKKKHKSVSGEALDESNSTNGETQNGENEDENDSETQEPEKKKKKKSKFNWEATVIAVLKSKGEMSLKRLSKKVLSEFAAQDAANYSQENLQAKLEKKLKKIAQVKVQKDRVKLK